MKKFGLFLAFVICGQFVSAQITKNPGDFNSVKVFDRIEVLLVQSSESRIEINGPKAGDVEVVNKNNELKIRMKLKELLQGDDVSVTLYYKNINEIEASEGARVSSQDVFKGTAFELNAKEGAEIKISLDVKNLDSKVSSGGILNISGSAENHDVTVLSGGILNARSLETRQTEVSVNAGGEAKVYATDYVDAKTRGGGDIDVYGNPAQVDKKTVIGGNINVID